MVISTEGLLSRMAPGVARVLLCAVCAALFANTASAQSSEKDLILRSLTEERQLLNAELEEYSRTIEPLQTDGTTPEQSANPAVRKLAEEVVALRAQLVAITEREVTLLQEQIVASRDDAGIAEEAETEAHEQPLETKPLRAQPVRHVLAQEADTVDRLHTLLEGYYIEQQEAARVLPTHDELARRESAQRDAQTMERIPFSIDKVRLTGEEGSTALADITQRLMDPTIPESRRDIAPICNIRTRLFDTLVASESRSLRPVGKNHYIARVRLQPGDTVLSMSLSSGGHLSHGAKPNQSGRWFNALHYGVDQETGTLNYDLIEAQALEAQPKLLIAGGSAYPRRIDFTRMRAIADKVGALFLVDMAHFAGLVAAGAHPNPFPQADVVTCTTTKTMRGARGGLIMTNNPGLAKKINSAVFPGVQGSVHLQVVLAKAVCLGEALRPEFKTYGHQVVTNARTLVDTLKARGHRIVSGGTDTHLLLLDVSPLGLTGDQAEKLLAQAHITSNKNPIPGDAVRPMDWVGLRLGTAAATTRGFDQTCFQNIGHLIADVLGSAEMSDLDRNQTLSNAQEAVASLCTRHPIYGR